MRQKEIQLNSDELRSYIDSVGYEKDNLLEQLRKETQDLGDESIMQVGSSQGKLLEIICRIGNFNKCIELGVFTGYSSICIAKGINDEGRLFAIDISEKYTSRAKKYWEKSGLDHKITLILDEAVNVLDTFIDDGLKGTFDFIFIDADKSNYIEYYKKSFDLIRSGGIIAIDNTIWKGKVFDNDDQTQSTKTIRDLNMLISNDSMVSQCIITMYDGMTLCLKK